MNNELDFYIKEFLVTYLPSYTTISKNTLLSYRDTFKLFINYLVQNNCKNINLSIYTYDNINNFIKWLIESRNSSERTCNQRLACMKSFNKYLILNEPTMICECQKIQEIKFKKYQQKEIKYLSIDEVKNIINKPKIDYKNGMREKLILSLIYYSGTRISELTNIKVKDINFTNNSLVVIGKGNKVRSIPLMNEIIDFIKDYILKEKLTEEDYLFLSSHGSKYTSNGIRYIINKYSDEIDFRVTPHTFRHSIASHLLEADTSLIYIRDFLGHEHLSTTENYAKVNINKKQEVLEKNMPQLEQNTSANWKEDNHLLEWLNSL